MNLEVLDSLYPGMRNHELKNGDMENSTSVLQAIFKAGKKSREWLTFKTITGLESMDTVHSTICTGRANLKEEGNYNRIIDFRINIRTLN